MREIKRIVVHCTGTPPFTPIANIQQYWRDSLGWKNSGYHYIITSNGEVIQLADENQICNGAKGFNHDSIHVAYVGGQTVNKRYGDTRTAAQKTSMFSLLRSLRIKYDLVPVVGHRDLPNVRKECPCFDAGVWYIEELVKTITFR